MEYINKEAMRILKLFGNEDVTSIKTTVGPEQEYFLVPKELYDQRKDLIYTGRTLFGAKAPKGQELDDHYFGTIKDRVAAYMADLNEELWKLLHSTNLLLSSQQQTSQQTTTSLQWKSCRRLQRNMTLFAFSMKNPLTA